MPAKDRIDWPYVVLLVGILVMVAAALHLLSTWLAFVIFAILWVGFRIWSKTHRCFPVTQPDAFWDTLFQTSEVSR